MRVLHLSTYDVRGGAARSAYRLHQGLREIGLHSEMLVRRKNSPDPAVLELDADALRPARRAVKEWKQIQHAWVDARRTPLSNTLFSTAFPGYDLPNHPAVRAADMLHLHWIWWMLSPQAVAALAQTGKPLVWTFHDQRAFTGGCHFSAGCRGFESGCEVCPQLRPSKLSITAAALADTKALLPAEKITVISPSRWLADCASASQVFARSRIEVIPYGIDTSVFQPQEPSAARAEFGINAKAFVFLFGADNTAEKRKGFGALIEALALLAKNPSVRARLASSEIQFVSFGEPHGAAAHNYPVPVLNVGRLDSDTRLARLYSAADALLLTSQEDNLPNVLLEALCCGTPAIAFDVGGVPDAVQHETNGLLVAPANADALAEAMARLSSSPELAARLRENCRSDAPERYALAAQARRYAALYEQLRPAQNTFATAADVTPVLPPGPHTAKLWPRLLTGARRHRRREWLRRFFPVLASPDEPA